jgi:hypothetical protein
MTSAPSSGHYEAPFTASEASFTASVRIVTAGHVAFAESHLQLDPFGRITARMGNHGGVVLPFRRPVVAALEMLSSGTNDEAANAAWDELIHAALRAWSWRDPETLDALIQQIAHVRPWVDRDWSA